MCGQAGRPAAGRADRVAGFAVVLGEPDYRDLAARRPSLLPHRCDGYPAYLAHAHRRLAAAYDDGKLVLIGPFLPDQYESYAEAIGMPPGGLRALRAYHDYVARAGPHTRAWTGEPIKEVVARLRAVTAESPADRR